MTTILVVDDEFLITDVLAFALEDEGFMVVRASNGKKGLDVLDRERPSLVITDYMMPVMNGVEFAQAIHGRHGEGMPIILMSGAHADLARQSGHLFACIFDKPFVVSEVVDAVIRLVGRPG
ncbi:response regulator [Pseudoroseomonas rhizosphaerae]|uniref:Response regulator n=1 Tax=Teichococcus rhizosphaerae TaxID=1335062 RepID=A0A2C6ZA03_9PROT|nr:response regulator [Pseudoroseomonas rhizosphaerae]PHK95341.1 response regulator [Pseudoroseomonas rhizosphaerae]